MQTCPNRGACLRGMGIDAASAYRCGFEIAGTVGACPRRRRLGQGDAPVLAPRATDAVQLELAGVG